MENWFETLLIIEEEKFQANKAGTGRVKEEEEVEEKKEEEEGEQEKEVKEEEEEITQHEQPERILSNRICAKFMEIISLYVIYEQELTQRAGLGRTRRP